MKEQTRKRAKEKVEEMYRSRDSHLHTLRKSRMNPQTGSCSIYAKDPSGRKNKTIQKYYWLKIMRKSTYKDAVELVGHLLLDTETTLNSGVSPVRLSWRKLSFHLQEAILRDVDLCLSRSVGPYVLQTHAGPVHAASVSVTSYVHQHCCI